MNLDISDPEQRIAERAYEIYLRRGGNNEDALGDWLQAKAEICGSLRGFEDQDNPTHALGDLPKENETPEIAEAAA
jgi:DUF2934 family protein